MSNWTRQLTETYNHMVLRRLIEAEDPAPYPMPNWARRQTGQQQDPNLPGHVEPAPGVPDPDKVKYGGAGPGGSYRPFDPSKETAEDFKKRMADMQQANRVEASKAQEEIDDADWKQDLAITAATIPLSFPLAAAGTIGRGAAALGAASKAQRFITPGLELSGGPLPGGIGPKAINAAAQGVGRALEARPLKQGVEAVSPYLRNAWNYLPFR